MNVDTVLNNMTKDKALMLALEALEGAEQINSDMLVAITALRTELERSGRLPKTYAALYPQAEYVPVEPDQPRKQSTSL